MEFCYEVDWRQAHSVITKLTFFALAPYRTVTHGLHKAGMLPAIWFIFSLCLCSAAANPLISIPLAVCCAVTHELHKAGMLPAIWFIFSRRECDLAARQLALHGVQLTSNEGN